MRRTPLLAAVVTAACGSSIDVEEARERSRAAYTPGDYEGVTRCGPPAPRVQSAGLLGFAGDEAAPRVEGYLDKDLIARPIRARASAFRACYLATLHRDPHAAGRVVASFQIDANGTVSSVEIEGFDAELDACVCAEVLRLQYPKFGSARFGSVTVKYPFIFQTP